MKQQTVGTYYIGHEQIQVVLREGMGGEFFSCPERGSVPRMKIGADSCSWPYIVGTVLHEAFEFQMSMRSCRLEPADDLGRDHAQYIFLMKHPQYSDICARVGQFMADALPDISRAWSKWKRNTKRR